jgi:uncharacterized membrane protein YeaQ/YmgE (transglycosylase-associated protein family)
MRERDDAEQSGSTAEFRAFVDSSGGPEATQAWSVRASRSRATTLVAVVIGAAVVLAIIAVLVIH